MPKLQLMLSMFLTHINSYHPEVTDSIISISYPRPFQATLCGHPLKQCQPKHMPSTCIKHGRLCSTVVVDPAATPTLQICQAAVKRPSGPCQPDAAPTCSCGSCCNKLHAVSHTSKPQQAATSPLLTPIIHVVGNQVHHQVHH
jgi:hypothetical protein